MGKLVSRIVYSKELLEDHVSSSSCWREVCQKIGLKPYSGSESYAKKRAIEFGVDFSHFTGLGWAKSKVLGSKRAIDHYLVCPSSIKSHTLRKRLIKEGIKQEMCESCGITEWMGDKVPLELDHKNSNPEDCRLDNLEILCANCHALKTARTRANKKQVRIPGNKPRNFDKPWLRKFEVTKAELEDLLANNTVVSIGKMYGVSDSAIHKRAKKLGVA